MGPNLFKMGRNLPHSKSVFDNFRNIPGVSKQDVIQKKTFHGRAMTEGFSYTVIV